MSRAELIFWFETPPKVSKGAFNYVTKYWGNEVFYIINNDFPEYRKATNWNDGDFGNANVVWLSESTDEDETIAKLFEKYPDAVHIVTSFTNTIQKKIRKFIFRPLVNVAVFSERPVQMGNIFEKYTREIYFQIKYNRLRRLFEPYIKVFLPLGQKGVDTFAKYGWSLGKMFPFMYNPIIHNIEGSHNTQTAKDSRIKFLYVGRFYYKTKGIDTLLQAAERLRGNWQLDLVGGYGKNKEVVINWANKLPNVKFAGSWQSQDVCTNMMEYDVVVVPSKYDGWNLLPNEAIYAGIGTIISDEAVSDEIITASGAGIVVPARNPQALAIAMQAVIDNHNLAQEWKKNAKNYVNKISPETVGQYFIDILDYTFYNTGQLRPECPWR